MLNLLPLFYDRENEDPYPHIQGFQDICNTFDEGLCTKELTKLKLFPFSLKDRAKHWLINLPPNSIGLWQELQKQFYEEFFLMHKTQAVIKKIQNFS